ncbi:MAG: GPR1/FUN34/YaaH family transporter [Gracilibacteraceae bacterium]|jgi:succinate-acetate transporter protein|nr:GPR1/FUN34/YaaH family transporter [Gracilibacteraceae bacterium]
METKVTNWANPTPAGLVALAVACFCFFAMLNGLVDASCLPLFGWILIGGFAIQIVVALLDLKSGSLTGGNTFLFFSAYFMLATGLGMLAKAGAASPLDSRIEGWLWLCLGIVLILWTPAFYKSPALLFTIVVLLDLAIPFIAIKDLALFPDLSATFAQIAGWLLLLTGVVGVYLSAATLVNGTFGKTVYWNPGLLYKEKAAKKDKKK